MRTPHIDRAFILAAGMGKRLRPHTDTMPKPMVPVAGKAMIDHTLDRLVAYGVHDVTVNLHYRATQLEQHLGQRHAPRLTFSFEQTLLDTGGGMKKALYTMGNQPFFAFSGDTLWEDGVSGDALTRMASAWDDSKMDLLMLLQPVSAMTLTGGVGDYDFLPNGQIVRSPTQTGTHMWTSVRIVHPRLFANAPDGPFSFLQLMDQAQANGRLFGLEHDGAWHHISTPADLANVEQHLAATGGIISPSNPTYPPAKPTA